MTTQLRLVETTDQHKRASDPLDDQTRERGRLGVRQAREALKDANRRVAEKEAARRASRERELTRLASAASRRRNAVSRGPRTPQHPGDPAAA